MSNTDITEEKGPWEAHPMEGWMRIEALPEKGPWEAHPMEGWMQIEAL